MQFTKQEKSIVQHGCIERYQFYKMSLELLGILMSQSCKSYNRDVNEAYSNKIKKLTEINTLNSRNYRTPKKHPVKFKLHSQKLVSLNKIKTSLVDVLFTLPSTSNKRVVSLSKLFNSPGNFDLNFILDNHYHVVDEHYKIITTKWVKVINTLNSLSSEIAYTLKTLIDTYGDIIKESCLTQHSFKQIARYKNMELRDCIEHIYSELFMHHKGSVDDLFIYTNNFKNKYFIDSKTVVSNEGEKQNKSRTGNLKLQNKLIFNPITLRCKLGKKYSKAIPNGEIFLTNITLELKVYKTFKAKISENIKSIQLDDGNKIYDINMVMHNRFHQVPSYLLPLIQNLLSQMEFVLKQKKNLFNEINSLINLVNMIDKNENFINLTSTY